MYMNHFAIHLKVTQPLSINYTSIKEGPLEKGEATYSSIHGLC